MGRLLAIDYGGRRTGIAVSDPLQIIATGLQTVETKVLMKFLKEYISSENIDKIIIGESKHLDNSKTDIAIEIESFAEKLKGEFSSIPIHWVDERFTSKMAKQSMIDSGLKKKKRRKKELVDEISATLILQSYMNTNN